MDMLVDDCLCFARAVISPGNNALMLYNCKKIATTMPHHAPDNIATSPTDF